MTAGKDKLEFVRELLARETGRELEKITARTSLRRLVKDTAERARIVWMAAQEAGVPLPIGTMRWVRTAGDLARVLERGEREPRFPEGKEPTLVDLFTPEELAILSVAFGGEIPRDVPDLRLFLFAPEARWWVESELAWQRPRFVKPPRPDWWEEDAEGEPGGDSEPDPDDEQELWDQWPNPFESWGLASRFREWPWIENAWSYLEEDWNDDETPLRKAVAEILLRDIHERLPAFAIVDRKTGRVFISREGSPASTGHPVALLPREIIWINWAESGPGYSWPESYHLVRLPVWDLFVVTRSTDSASAVLEFWHVSETETLSAAAERALDIAVRSIAEAYTRHSERLGEPYPRPVEVRGGDLVPTEVARDRLRRALDEVVAELFPPDEEDEEEEEGEER
ncbi:MAG: hypothetical protein D6718_12595 [Acidobacteria bacterium]|nr:MAG: hypothetical protein D6718_12595 [Acidobacteriota bacterium]